MGNTSTEAKRRYNEKAYSQIRAAVPKDLAEDFKEKCDAAGISQASVIKSAIKQFLGRPE